MAFEFKIDEAPVASPPSSDHSVSAQPPVQQPVRAWLLVVAAALGIVGLLMMIIPLAGSSSLRALLVVLFLAVGIGLIALAVWLSRNPDKTLGDAGDGLEELFESRKVRKQARKSSKKDREPVAAA